MWLRNEKSGKKMNYMKQPWWIAGPRAFAMPRHASPGMGSFILGQAANMPAMALAPQTMLSCLGGLSLVFNSAYAHVLLGERLVWSEVLVMMAMVTGAVPRSHGEPTRM